MKLQRCVRSMIAVSLERRDHEVLGSAVRHVPFPLVDEYAPDAIRGQEPAHRFAPWPRST